MASIEEEIRQKAFKNEYSKLMINTLFTSSWLHGLQSQMFKTHGLTSQQYNTLRILRGQHPDSATVNLIKERMIDKMSNVSRIVDKLKAKGLVTRKTSRHDRRQVDVKITDKGLDLLAQIDTELVDWEKQIRTITEEEAKTINSLLDKWRG